MKANELRIGNWVTGFDKYGSYGQILSIWDNQTRTDIKYNNPNILLEGGYCGGLIAELQPIPLTPEILEKAGFVEWATGHWKTKNELNNGAWSDRFNYYLPYTNLDTYTGNIQIEYLHQLQNLYFALTGEELTIDATLHSQATTEEK